MIEALLREMPGFVLMYSRSYNQFKVLDLKDLDTMSIGTTAQEALQKARPLWEEFYGDGDRGRY